MEKKMRATRDKRIGGYHYRGYYFDLPEGCKVWNIYKKDEGGQIDFCFPEANADSYNDAKATIDSLVATAALIANTVGKKYEYMVVDTGEIVYADSGDEFDQIWSKSHTERPEGAIRVTNIETGYSNVMYPVKIVG